MAYKRILTIQDISCVGQCSLTVALPVLSACGHETCILPTAVLSTHTGGFGKPVVSHLGNITEQMWKHWQENDITFDAILVGYLGSVEAVHTAGKIMDSMLAPGGVSIVDPAFADHGKCYSGLTPEYVRAMEELCTKAHIIMPNVTEAAMFAGEPYREEPDEKYVSDLLDKLNHPCVILTGTGFAPEMTGVTVREGERQYLYTHAKVGKNCHGTGDMFAACFTGALMQGKNKETSVKIAANFVCRAIENTVSEPVHWYGVKFETALPDLIRVLQK